LGSAPGIAPSPPQLVRTNGSRHKRRIRFGLVVAALVAVWLLICAQGVPLLAQLRIKDSQTYAKRGDTTEALRAAMDARNLQPWASRPYLQLALVSRQQGLYGRAHVWIERAIERNPTDWQLWVVASDLEIRLGNARLAERSMSRAISLNPRSPVLNS
jgi:Flp pilus assembly protein TadD